MTTFSLGQQWVSKVTTADEDDMPVVGFVERHPPRREELDQVLAELARSETVREMSRRKWIQPTATTVKHRVVERGGALLDFLTAHRPAMPAYAMFKRREARTGQALINEVATQAWISHITQNVQHVHRANAFRANNLSRDFLRSVAQLSTRPDGPRSALNAVRNVGIHVIIESGLPGMSVDGASFHHTGSAPVIALTARLDRLDNFWFTLFHELGHIYLHLRDPSVDIFVDSEEEAEGDDLYAEREAEANAFAKDSLIPRDLWLRSDAYRIGSEASVIALAKQLDIHAAIVAGRIRHERRDFRLFNDLIGQGQVREVVFGA